MSDNYDKVITLLPMSGANAGTSFPDWGPAPKTWTRHGTSPPTTVTAQSKYYGSSGLFPLASSGTPPHLRLTQSGLFSGLFTIECWVRVGATSDFAFILDARNNSAFTVANSDDASKFAFYLRGSTNSLALNYGAASTVLDGGAYSANTWHHFAMSRDGSNLVRLFIDGSVVASDTIANNFSNPYLTTGIAVGTAQQHWKNDLRVIDGACLYTGTFTPPARLVGVISNASGAPVRDINGDPAARTILAIPRSAPTSRLWSGASNGSGVFSIDAPAGVDHTVIALADESSLYNDLVHRVIPV